MDNSILDRLKTLVHALVPLSGDVILVVLGLFCFAATLLIARQPPTWAWALLPGLGLALAIEGWEIWDHYGAAGLARASARDLIAILWRHSRDVAVFNLAPIAVFLGAVAWQRWAAR